MTLWYEGLFNLLWYTRSPCFDVRNMTSVFDGEWSLLKECRWKGFKIPCSAIFTTYPTDRGFCCAFNMEKAEEVFEKSKFTNLVKTHQYQDKKMSFGINTPPKWYVSGNEPIPRPGIHEGLSLLIDSHDDFKERSSVDEDFNSFITYVSSGSNFPLTAKSGFYLQGGHVNNVIIKAYDVTSDPDIKSIDPNLRQCYFPDEQKLSICRNYSQSCCMLECRIKYAYMATGLNCTPWYFPNQKEPLQMCDPWEAGQFENEMFKHIPQSQCNYCLPDCSETVYSASCTVAPFRRCDHKNLGVSHLCNLNDPELPQPRIWGHQVIEEYENNPELQKSDGKIPSYIKKGVIVV